MTIDIPIVFASSDREFSVSNGDFSTLEIRDGNNAGFHYFYDTATRGLVTDFVLEDRPRVATLCRITLIKKGDIFTPRLCLWKKDKSKAGREPLRSRLQLAGLRDLSRHLSTRTAVMRISGRLSTSFRASRRSKFRVMTSE